MRALRASLALTGLCPGPTAAPPEPSAPATVMLLPTALPYLAVGPCPGPALAHACPHGPAWPPQSHTNPGSPQRGLIQTHLGLVGLRRCLPWCLTSLVVSPHLRAECDPTGHRLKHMAPLRDRLTVGFGPQCQGVTWCLPKHLAAVKGGAGPACGAESSPLLGG